jgi:hypothetical protein
MSGGVSQTISDSNASPQSLCENESPPTTEGNDSYPMETGIIPTSEPQQNAENPTRNLGQTLHCELYGFSFFKNLL